MLALVYAPFKSVYVKVGKIYGEAFQTTSHGEAQREMAKMGERSLGFQLGLGNIYR